MKILRQMRAIEAALIPPARSYGVLVLLGALAWMGVIHDGYVSYDTGWLWDQNPVLSGGELGRLGDIWTNFSIDTRLALGAEYLPVRDTNTLLDFLLFGKDWRLHHAANLAWYLAGCALFLSICRKLLGAGLPAWLAASWFTLHPVHTENIAWLAGRKDVLGLTLALAAWRCWLQAREDSRLNLPALMFFILAVWSKNTYIVLPAVLLMCDGLVYRQNPWARKMHWLTWGTLTATLVALSTQLGKAMHLFGEQHYTGIAQGMAMQCQLWLRDLAHLAWPMDLAMTYPVPSGAAGPWLIGAIGTLTVLLVWAIKAKATAPIIPLGIATFFIASLPTSVFISLQNVAADRYLLLPSAGIALCLGALLKSAWTDARMPWLTGVSLLAVCTLGTLSAQQTQHWRSDVSLWAASASAQPSVLRNVLQHAKALNNAGESTRALEVLQSTADRFGEQARFFQVRGTIHMKTNDITRAEQDYRHALRLDPQLRVSGNDLAVILSKTGRLREAIEVATQVTAAHPRYAKGFNTLGALLLNARALKQAETALLRAELLSYEDPSAACNLGGVYWLQLQSDPSVEPEAVHWWTMCKRRRPGVATPPGLALPD